ncbi:MAG: glycoside hydrolase family 88 protein [Lysobacterales bacterium]|jgi:rhamnogalacturonyl hydrolase YesR
MKTSGLLFLFFVTLPGCEYTGEEPGSPVDEPAETPVEIIAHVEVSNPSGFARPDTWIDLSFNELGVDTGPLQVRDDDAPRPAQLLDNDGDGAADQLVFMADLDPAGTHRYTVERPADHVVSASEPTLADESGQQMLPPRIRLKTTASSVVAKLDPLELSTQLALSEMKRRGDSLSYGGWDTVRGRESNWTYTTGLLMEAMDDVAVATGNETLAAYAKRTMDSYLAEDGVIHTYKAADFNIDHINPGKMLQRLYEKYGDEKYLDAINTLAAQLADHPRTSEGAFWHKKRYPNQLWLDGVYMGMPFLAGVGVMEGDEHKIEEAVREFAIARSHLRDENTGLYYHAWDEARVQEWADSETGRSRYFWGRGLGWYAMALVDILDVIPAELTELREPLIANVRELADDLLRCQDETGTWYQILDMPDEPGNYREASASSMFTYFLAKAVNRGYLPDSYAAAARKSYAGLVDEFIAVYADGSFNLSNICEVAGLGYGRDGSYRYYMSERVVSNDPKGLAPAIMAGVQVARLPE